MQKHSLQDISKEMRISEEEVRVIMASAINRLLNGKHNLINNKPLEYNYAGLEKLLIYAMQTDRTLSETVKELNEILFYTPEGEPWTKESLRAYIEDSKKVYPYEDVISYIQLMRIMGYNLSEMLEKLNKEKILTRQGKPWSRQNLQYFIETRVISKCE